jgi:hypothetical protein
MGVKPVVAVTDGDWFDHLRAMPHLTEVNFWSPSDRTFRSLQPGELFLFKLHAPRNFIVGGGWFAHATILPCSLAWVAFGEENGAATLGEMRARIIRYTKRSADDREDFHIGCRILTQPFFLPEYAWIPVGEFWPRNIALFKTYSTDEADGMQLWDKIQDAISAPASPGFLAPPAARYGESMLVRLKSSISVRLRPKIARDQIAAVAAALAAPQLQDAPVFPPLLTFTRRIKAPLPVSPGFLFCSGLLAKSVALFFMNRFGDGTKSEAGMEWTARSPEPGAIFWRQDDAAKADFRFRRRQSPSPRSATFFAQQSS